MPALCWLCANRFERGVWRALSLLWEQSFFDYLGIPARSRLQRHCAAYPLRDVSGSIFALQQLHRHSARLPRLDCVCLRHGITDVIYQQALYPTAVVDVPYADFDKQINALLRRVLCLPGRTHVVHFRYELAIWPSEFFAAARALQFAWQVRHNRWYSSSFTCMAKHYGNFEYTHMATLPVFHRLTMLLESYGLSWEQLLKEEIFENWQITVRLAITAQLRRWVRAEAIRTHLHHLLTPAQALREDVLERVFYPKQSGPLAGYLLVDGGLARIALQFRSDRVRFSVEPNPKCLWCSQGRECGRHFVSCPALPPALLQTRDQLFLDLTNFATTHLPIPRASPQDLLVFDDPRLSNLLRIAPKDRNPAAVALVKACLIWQRCVLRLYRSQFFDDATNWWFPQP